MAAFFQICSEHGTVNRVALIKRSGLLQALVEFEDAEMATKAKYGLNGADIYDGSCTIKVRFDDKQNATCLQSSKNDVKIEDKKFNLELYPDLHRRTNSGENVPFACKNQVRFLPEQSLRFSS